MYDFGVDVIPLLSQIKTRLKIKSDKIICTLTCSTITSSVFGRVLFCSWKWPFLCRQNSEPAVQKNVFWKKNNTFWNIYVVETSRTNMPHVFIFYKFLSFTDRYYAGNLYGYCEQESLKIKIFSFCKIELTCKTNWILMMVDLEHIFLFHFKRRR